MTSPALSHPLRTEAEARAATGVFEIVRDGQIIYATVGLGKVPGVMRNNKITVCLSPAQSDEIGDEFKKAAREARGA